MSLYKISDIEKTYPNWYDPKHQLSREDQQFIWENTPLPKENTNNTREQETTESVSVIGSVNGTYKDEIKSEQNWYKSELISKLKLCSSETPCNEIELLLKGVFRCWMSYENHWLWVAQTYTPRTLNWVMAATIKKHLRSGIRKNPAAYFTYMLAFRKERKEFRRTNGSYKTKNT